MRYEANPKGFSDWVGLHNLLVECFAYMDDIIDPPSSLHSLTPQDLKQKAAQQTLILVWDDKTLVASAFLDIRTEVVYIGKIAVAQTHRGQGIAKNIMIRAKYLAIQNNKQWLELETRIELTDNHQAFAKLGFLKISEGSHKGFTHPTCITMRKKITVS